VTRIKICGVRTPGDARACVDAGVDAIGVNFVPSSPRCVDAEAARAIVREVGGGALVVGLVAGMPLDAILALRDATGVGCLQVHGDDGAAVVGALLPHAYASVPVATAEDAARAAAMPGDYVMVDSKVAGALGGTGHAFDWSLVVELAKKRRVVLAGGLTPANVGRAIAQVHPWCVDVASGVESAPGVKDAEKVKAFVAAARRETR
jgi:phosphoribosylanthranilate isomerase